MMMSVMRRKWGSIGGKEEDEVRNFHSAQLLFARSNVPIGVGNSFLKI